MTNSKTIEPFKINIREEVLSDLECRLKGTRWAYGIDGTNWDAGTNLDYLKELVVYWREVYDWRRHEAQLNRFHHYTTDLNGFGIHFVYERGKGPRPFPIVLTHGYPDSSYRFAKIIPMLTDPESFGGRAEDSF
jgi:hypothetical protein